MGKGKLAAQCGHAVIEAFLKTQIKSPNDCKAWLSEGQMKVVVKIDSEKALLELFENLKNQFPCALIKDAGRTQIEPGTITCMGIGPVEESKIDKYTSNLKLM